MKTLSSHLLSPATSRCSHQDRTRAALLALVVVTLLPVVGFAQDSLPEGWVSFDGLTAVATAPTLEITSSDLSELTLLVTTPGVVSTAVVHEDTEYAQLSFPGYHHTTEVGYPCIPTLRQLIAVPEGCEMGVSVSTGDSVIYTDATVYPVEAAVTRYTEEGWPYIAYEFAQDGDAYAAIGYYPAEIASVSDEGSLRGQGVALLTVHPIQYDAAARRLRAFPSLAVTVRFSGGVGTLSEPLGPLSPIAEQVLLNYQGTAYRGRGSAGPGRYEVCRNVEACEELGTDYLMIVEGSLMGSAWVDTLALHRATWNGWNVAIVPDSAVIANYQAGEISDEAIKEFIREVYETGSAEHMDDDRLGYALLVGDARSDQPDSLLPAHEGGSSSATTTDHWYACVHGDDVNADLMIGRLCAGDTTELEREVTKFTTYETDADSTRAWRDKVLLSCGYAWIHDPDCGSGSQGAAEHTHACFDSAKAIIVPRGYGVTEVHTHLEDGETCGAQNILARADNRAVVNGGAFIVEMAVHGDWASCYAFLPADVNALTNADSLCFWVSLSCLTGGYDYVEDDTPSDCLGERLQHQNCLNGAVAFFGSAELSYEEAIDYLGRYIWEGFFEAHLHSLGEAIEYAKLKHFSVTGSSLEVLAYNLLGDPALNLFLTNTTGYGTKPDYVVDPSDLMTSPEFASVSQPALLQAVVHNRSNFDPEDSVPVILTLCERDGTQCAALDTVPVWPMAWSADTASVVWDIGEDDIGQWLLKATVDPEDEQDELFEDNNAAETFVGAYFERAGFPDTLGGTGGLSPTVANVDTDPEFEILAAVRSPGKVVLCSHEGEPEDDFNTPAGAPVRGPVAVADLHCDGEQEVVVCYGDSVLALNADGLTPAWGSPHYAEGLDGSSPTVADVIGGDGELEVLVQRSWCAWPGWRDALDVLSADGSLAWRDSILGNLSEAAYPERGPCVGDLEGDGTSEVVGVYRGYPNAVRVVKPDGESFMWAKGLDVPAGVRACSPVLVDVCRDSIGLEVLCGVDTLRCHEADGDLAWFYRPKGHIAGIAAADLDDDVDLEVAVSTYRTAAEPGGVAGWVYVVDSDGALADSIRCEYGVTTGPVVADLDGDLHPEIMVGCSCWRIAEPARPWVSHLEIFTFDPASGLEPFFERPLFFWGELTSTPAIADADLDGHMEIYLVDGMGLVHCLEYYWETGLPSRWASFQHDERHTGVYETPVSGAYPDSSLVSWWGDYLMTGDVTIAESSSLFVQPGTTVRAACDADDQAGGAADTLAELIVQGGLTVSGQPLHEPRFISACESPGASDWYGIRLLPGSSGSLSDAVVSYGFIGINANNPTTLRVEDCTVTEHEPTAIKCIGNEGESVVDIVGNTLGAKIGVELHCCAATVDSNTIETFDAYGMKIYQDQGSRIRANTILPATWTTAFSGLLVNWCEGGLVIARNTVGGEGISVPNTGIRYEYSQEGDEGIIKLNTVIGSAETSSSTSVGMYFLDADPLVRENTLCGELFQYAFRAQGPSGLRPDLGRAVDDTCASCADTTLSGCNRVVPENAPELHVKAPSPGATVWAQCNYWEPVDPTKFSATVQWQPYLPRDPGRGRMAPEEEEGPEALSLAFLQNTPNPFNPETTFRFSLAERAGVRLDVYDLAGRHVRALVDGETLDPGWHEEAWNGMDDRGHRVATGVYFCRLQVGSRELSRKVVVLK